MVLVTGTVRLRPGVRDAAVAAARAVAERTRDEPGCLAYRFSFDLDDPDLVGVHEEWSDDAALQAHRGTPHVAAFRAALGDLVAAPPEFTRWVGAEARPLTDEA